MSATYLEFSRPSAGASPSPIFGDYSAYGCRLNAVDVETLFDEYDRAGFLYAQKRQRLAPYLEQIKDNLARLLRAGPSLVKVVTYGEPGSECFGSIMQWRHTRRSFHVQHLVSIGGPRASRAVMLAGQAVYMKEGWNSAQCWFSPTNKFASRVFGSITTRVGAETSHVYPVTYLWVPRRHLGGPASDPAVRIVPTPSPRQIFEFARKHRGEVYAAAEELNDPDLELHAVDREYRKAGLRRTRQVRAAFLASTEELAGIALAHRGPLGLNLSFLENRCDLIVDETLALEERRRVGEALLKSVAEEYAGFAPDAVPVVLDERTAPAVEHLGGQKLRDYAQSIWLEGGFVGWYRHVEAIYDRFMRVATRRGLAG